MIISYANLEDYWDRSAFTDWYSRFILTFVELAENTNLENLQVQLPALLDSHCPEDLRSDLEIKLEPITRIHLTDNNQAVLKSIKAKLFFAGLMILIACINFINLTTARSMQRAKEIGLRKVLGGQRKQLVKQFLSEALIFCILALLLGIGLVEFLLFLNPDMFGDTAFDYGNNFTALLTLFGLTIFTGILAGSYPAFFLSSFNPTLAIKGGLKSGKAHTLVRKTLVITQFVVAVFFLISASTISKQMNFMINQDLGFDQENILVINSVPREFSIDGINKLETVKNELQALSEVSVTSLFWDLPRGRASTGGMQLYSNGLPPNQAVTLSPLTVDESYLDVFGLELKEGRFFSKDFFQSDTNSIVLNEFAAKALNLENPVGETLRLENQTHLNVIGVVEDFNINPFDYGSEQPLAFISVYRSQIFRHLSLKLHSEDILKTVSHVETVWQAIFPDVPFEFEFMDQVIQKSFINLQTLRKQARISTTLAGFVAGLGLLGLAAFTAARRTKEIGVRKVLGATVSGIIHLLTKEFVKLVIIACAIASPIAYIVMNEWLQNYPNRIEITFTSLLSAGFIALALTLLIISFQAIKAALANPVEALRYE